MKPAFTVDPASTVVDGYAHTIYGTKDPRIVAMTVNGVAGRITFPTSTSWSLNTVLSPGTNTFSIQGQDVSMVWTAPEVVTAVLPYFTPEEHSNFNVLDEHGLEIGLSRNRGEKNWDYRTRLLSFAAAHTDASLEGLFQAACHEFGLRADSAALSVRCRRDAADNLVSDSTRFEITPVGIYVDADKLVAVREAHRVEPRFRRIQLDHQPRFAEELRVYNLEDGLVAPRRYDVDLFKNTVTFRDDDLNATWVTVTYPYRQLIDHRALTMGELETQLEAVQLSGQGILDVEVSDPTAPAFGLMQVGRIPLDRSWVAIPGSRVRVTGLDDKAFQQSLLNAFGAAYDSKLERYARAARAKSNIGWDNLVLDEGLWDTDATTRGLDYLPRLFDAVFGRWYCTHPGHATTFNLVEVNRHGGRCPDHPSSQLLYAGVDREQIKSGIGEGDALYSVVDEVPEEL